MISHYLSQGLTSFWSSCTETNLNKLSTAYSFSQAAGQHAVSTHPRYSRYAIRLQQIFNCLDVIFLCKNVTQLFTLANKKEAIQVLNPGAWKELFIQRKINASEIALLFSLVQAAALVFAIHRMTKRRDRADPALMGKILPTLWDVTEVKVEQPLWQRLGRCLGSAKLISEITLALFSNDWKYFALNSFPQAYNLYRLNKQKWMTVLISMRLIPPTNASRSYLRGAQVHRVDIIRQCLLIPVGSEDQNCILCQKPEPESYSCKTNKAHDACQAEALRLSSLDAAYTALSTNNYKTKNYLNKSGFYSHARFAITFAEKNLWHCPACQEVPGHANINVRAIGQRSGISSSYSITPELPSRPFYLSLATIKVLFSAFEAALAHIKKTDMNLSKFLQFFEAETGTGDLIFFLEKTLSLKEAFEDQYKDRLNSKNLHRIFWSSLVGVATIATLAPILVDRIMRPTSNLNEILRSVGKLSAQELGQIQLSWSGPPFKFQKIVQGLRIARMLLDLIGIVFSNKKLLDSTSVALQGFGLWCSFSERWIVADITHNSPIKNDLLASFQQRSLIESVEKIQSHLVFRIPVLSSHPATGTSCDSDSTHLQQVVASIYKACASAYGKSSHWRFLRQDNKYFYTVTTNSIDTLSCNCGQAPKLFSWTARVFDSAAKHFLNAPSGWKPAEICIE